MGAIYLMTLSPGTWLHGSGASKPISDRTPIDDPMELTRWRLKIENKAVSSISRSFTANVIRPSLLYGGSGSLFAMMFSAARDNGVAEWYGDEGSTMATIHREDLGEAFRLCAEKVKWGRRIIDMRSVVLWLWR